MALVSNGYEASITIADAAGDKFVWRPQIVAADLATASTVVNTLALAMDVLTDAIVRSYKVSEEFVEDTETYGAPGSEVEARARVTCPLEAPDKTHTFTIPAPIDALFMATQGPDRNKVNTASGLLISFINHFTDETGYGTPGPDAIALVSDGEKIRPDNANDRPFITSGKRTHVKSRVG